MCNVQSTTLADCDNNQPTACTVKPLERVTFTPFEVSDLKPVISGTVFNALDTSSGNWRVRIVCTGQPFPFGESVNVYTHEGTFTVRDELNPDIQPAVA